MAIKRSRSTEAGPVKAKARSDAYVGMLAISLISLIICCVLLYMDYSQYPTAKPKMPEAPKVAAAPKPGGTGPKGP